MPSYGQALGHQDLSFFQKLPAAGTKVVVIRCLCNLYELSLANGCATLTGAFIEAFGRVLGMHLILSNCQTDRIVFVDAALCLAV